MMKWFFCFSLFVLSACAHHEPRGADIGTRIDSQDYDQLIDKFTRHDVQYDGFYNKFELYVTFINSEVQAAFIQKRSDIFQWDLKQAQAEREKMMQENSTQTKFALSFFVPSTRLNDLNKGSSIWKIYLEANGQRYEGRATKRNGKLEEIRAMFPHHNRWSTPYEITFNVPLSGIEGAPVKFIIASSQGKAVLDF